MPIIPLKMPKWGLSMQEGLVQAWHRQPGDEIAEGMELVDVETSKITNVFEAPYAGTLRRITAPEGETLPVGALLAVLADDSVSDAEIDAFVTDFQARFTPEGEEAGAAGLEEKKVTLPDGRVMRVTKAGAGETPVVFLHGFGGDLNNWALVQPAVAAAAATIAIDLPGHGASSKDVGAGDLPALASAVGETLNALGADKVHLVGHSLGGAVALAMALSRPDRTASLTLVCPAAIPGTSLNGDYLDGFISASRARNLADVLGLLFADPATATRDMAEEILKSKRLDGVEEALSAIRAAMAAPTFAAVGAQIGSVSAPLLVLASRQDRIVGAPDAAALPAGATLVWVDGAGHMPHTEKADAVSAAIITHVSA
jgi:pyruvate dehydrogenase E2 component (dihydrolipoamide acetyltransferase)